MGFPKVKPPALELVDAVPEKLKGLELVDAAAKLKAFEGPVLLNNIKLCRIILYFQKVMVK